MKASRHILAIVFCLLTSTFWEFTYAQNFKFMFMQDRSAIDFSFADNRNEMERLCEALDSLVAAENIDSILVSSTSSPEGTAEYNYNLSTRRSGTISSLLASAYPAFSHLIRISNKIEDWQCLKEYVLADVVLTPAQRDEVIAIIDSEASMSDKEAKLRSLPYYTYVSDTLLPHMRYSSVELFCPVKEAEVEAVFTQPVESEIPVETPDGLTAEVLNETDNQKVTEVVSVQVTPLSSPKTEVLYIRTNLLAPLANFGIEVPIGNSWSAGADYYYPWIFRNPDHRNCFQILGWSLEGRYWFGKDRTEEDRLEGHSLGVNVSAGYYDIGMNFTGNQGEFAVAGVDYLYALPVCKDRLHLEFNLGVGYIYSNVKPYDVFEEGGKAFKEGYIKKFHWVGPVKAGVSLVVPITVKNRSEK